MKYEARNNYTFYKVFDLASECIKFIKELIVLFFWLPTLITNQRSLPIFKCANIKHFLSQSIIISIVNHNSLF